jgi:enoyl-CoA hydratase/carnithine racemase
VFDERVPDDDVLSRALEVARELAAHPPRTFELVKRRLRAGQPVATSLFGGAAETNWALEEAATAGRAVLDDPR